jgi:anhydro-N-acetylmuramic acid kinase
MPEYYAGLMSGTSLDGVDAVVAATRGERLRVLGSLHRTFPAALRRRLLDLHGPGADELHRAALVANELSAIYAKALTALLARSRIGASHVAAVGCHGQTIRHRPGAGYTTQLVNGALLAELTGITAVCDFRSRDIAAGGEGAPLAPAFHEAAFRSRSRNRAIVNLGGIANITCLPARGRVTGFDCGPGNMLMDAWIQESRGAPFDSGGEWAASGRMDTPLLRKLLSHPFLRRRPPKSAGRAEFNLAWLRRSLAGAKRPADVQATLLEFTAITIARALRACRPPAKEIYLCGGGARNRALVARLASLLPGRTVASTETLGVAAEHVEALAFAWLARRALEGKAGNVPAVTGARGPRLLGAIYRA